ncbi:sensor histidine kinase [Halobacterium sp. KA-6]|jgi:two-component system sensor histidine kinase RegB|uniref:sensor histidine kinase n=1 Tax=Halobacterium sp. KA-6 TaxID=2896368 RepID=UPI001E4FF207|nr:HAMP domain-containing sensor histidine kinase [Halobacterium sp. KA-6]MCD2203480.1 HAMP domain-containing histidine kinase [Halobacterium sp. KA-6]
MVGLAHERLTDAAAHWWFYVYAVVGFVAAVGYGYYVGWSVAVGLEVLILLSLAATLVHSGIDARGREISQAGLVRATGLTALTGVSFALLAVAISLIWQLEGHPVVDTEFMVVFAMWLGLAVGAQASLYAVGSEEKRTRLADLVKLLTMNQRVLRHNLRNELSVVDGHLQNLEEKVGSDDEDVTIARHHVDELLETSERTRRILGIWGSDECREQDAGAVLADAVERLRERYPDVDVEIAASEDAVVSAHSALGDAVYEVLANAVEHNDEDVRILASVTNPPDDDVVFEVADTGSGIPDHERYILDQPEETTLSHASGLGLWLVYWTVRESGGTVDFADDADGSTVRLTLPDATVRPGLWGRLVGRSR